MLMDRSPSHRPEQPGAPDEGTGIGLILLGVAIAVAVAVAIFMAFRTYSKNTRETARRRAAQPGHVGVSRPRRTRATGARIAPHAAGWSSLVARRAHNPKVAGSNPAPAIRKPPLARRLSFLAAFLRLESQRGPGGPETLGWSASALAYVTGLGSRYGSGNRCVTQRLRPPVEVLTMPIVRRALPGLSRVAALVALLVTASLALASGAFAATPPLVGAWNFASGSTADSTGNWSTFNLNGSATLSSTGLVVNGTRNGNGRPHGPAGERLQRTGADEQDPGGLGPAGQHDGRVRVAARALQAGGDGFDAIVYAEQNAGQWMAGSEFFSRTSPFPTVISDTWAPDGMRQVAVSYSGTGVPTISGCLNGKSLGSYAKGAAASFAASDNPRALFGPRHMSGGASGTPVGSIAAHIAEARIYAGTMTCEEVAGSTARRRSRRSASAAPPASPGARSSTAPRTSRSSTRRQRRRSPARSRRSTTSPRPPARSGSSSPTPRTGSSTRAPRSR